MENNKKFNLPQRLLDQVNECTAGYVLVTISSEGNFECYVHGDDRVCYTALVAHALRFARALDNKLDNEVEAFIDGQDDEDESKEKESGEFGASDED